MVTKNSLAELQKTNIGDFGLKDISDITIDKDKSVAQRIQSFIEEAGNPYLFKVGGTTVKVSFTPFAPTLQQSLEKLFTH